MSKKINDNPLLELAEVLVKINKREKIVDINYCGGEDD